MQCALSVCSEEKTWWHRRRSQLYMLLGTILGPSYTCFVAALCGFRVGVHADWHHIEKLPRARWPFLLDAPWWECWKPGRILLILTLHLSITCISEKKKREMLGKWHTKTFYISISSKTKLDRSNWVYGFRLYHWSSCQWNTNVRIQLSICADQEKLWKNGNSWCINRTNLYQLLSSVWTCNKNKKGEKSNASGNTECFPRKKNRSWCGWYIRKHCELRSNDIQK